MPAGRGMMQIERYVNLTVSIAEASQGYFCNASIFPLIAVFTYPKGAPTGTTTFYAWTDNTHSTELGSTIFSGEYADYSLPANILTANTPYYLQAVYSGDGTYLPTSSPAGTSGTFIEGIIHDTTSIGTPILYSYTPVGSFPGFCENSSITLHATVTSTRLPTPSEGTVTFTGTYTPREGDPVVVTLGTATPSSGLATLTISNPYTAFDEIDEVNWVITASYTGNSCYANAGPSAGLTVFPTLNGIDIQITSGSSLFCYTSAETYVVNVSSSAAGTASGNIQLTLWYTPTGGSQTSILLYNNNVSGSVGGSGFNTSIPFAANAFEAISGLDGTVSDVYLQAYWDPDSGSCYAAQLSPNYNITVTSYVTQSPTLTLGVSTTNGSGYSNSVTIPSYGDNIYFRASFNKEGNPGSLTGANIIITATGGYTSSPFTVTDGGNTFNVDFSIVETAIGGETGGTFTAQATSDSNSCWNNGNSNTVTLNLPVEPPH